jgi:hypothetical protein
MLGPAVVAMSIGVSGAITPLVDRSAFSGVEHTLIDFEARGDGSPLELFPNSAFFIPNSEYASSGIEFADAAFAIVHLSEVTDIWQAFIAQSSPENTLDAANAHTYSFLFDQTIHSIGYEMIFWDLGFSQPPRLQAFDSLDNLLGEIVFDEMFIDGTTGFFNEVGYGFMGLSSSTPIAKVTLNNMFFTVIDDLYFSAAIIPAPGVLTLALPFSLAGIRRRQRALPPRANTIPPTILVKH